MKLHTHSAGALAAFAALGIEPPPPAARIWINFPGKRSAMLKAAGLRLEYREHRWCELPEQYRRGLQRVTREAKSAV